MTRLGLGADVSAPRHGRDIGNMNGANAGGGGGGS